MLEWWVTTNKMIKKVISLGIFALAAGTAYCVNLENHELPVATGTVSGGEIALSTKHHSNVLFTGLILRMKETRLEGIITTIEAEDGLQFKCYIAEDAIPAEGLRVGQRIRVVGSSMGTGAMLANRPGSITLLERKPTVLTVHSVTVHNGIGKYFSIDHSTQTRTLLPDGFYPKLYLVVTADGGVLQEW